MPGPEEERDKRREAMDRGWAVMRQRYPSLREYPSWTSEGAEEAWKAARAQTPSAPTPVPTPVTVPPPTPGAGSYLPSGQDMGTVPYEEYRKEYGLGPFLKSLRFSPKSGVSGAEWGRLVPHRNLQMMDAFTEQMLANAEALARKGMGGKFGTGSLDPESRSAQTIRDMGGVGPGAQLRGLQAMIAGGKMGVQETPERMRLRAGLATRHAERPLAVQLGAGLIDPLLGVGVAKTGARLGARGLRALARRTAAGGAVPEVAPGVPGAVARETPWGAARTAGTRELAREFGLVKGKKARIPREGEGLESWSTRVGSALGKVPWVGKELEINPQSPLFDNKVTRAMQMFWDDSFLLRQMSGRATKRAAAEDTELTLNEQMDLLGGGSKKALVRAELAIKQAQEYAQTSVRNESFVDDMNQFLSARRAIEIFEKHTEREAVGGFSDIGEARAVVAGLERTLGREGSAELERAAGVVRDLYRQNLDMYVKEGMISREAAEELRNSYKWYNPVRYKESLDAPRMLLDRDTAPTAKQMVGTLSKVGDIREIKEPLSVLGEELMRGEHHVGVNQIKRTVIGLAQEENTLARAAGKEEMHKGVGGTDPKEYPPTPVKEWNRTKRKSGETVLEKFRDEEGTVAYFDPLDPGKVKVVEVDPALYREINYLGGRTKARNIPTMIESVVRATAVTYNPAFIVANVLNDMLAAYTRAGVLPHEVAAALRQTLRAPESLARPGSGQMFPPEMMQAYTLAGGGQGRFWAQMAEEIAREGDKVVPGAEKVKNVGDLAKRLAGAIPRAGEIGELAPRMAAVKKRMDVSRPGWRRELESGSISPWEMAQKPEFLKATAEGVNATINFRRGGSAIKWLNDYVVFLNASTEGSKLVLRALLEDPRKAGTRIAGLMLGQMALTAYNMQYDEYWDLSLRERLGSGVIMLPGSERDDQGRLRPKRLNLPPVTREMAAFLAPAVWLMEKMSRADSSGFNQFVLATGHSAFPLTGIPLPTFAEAPIELVSNRDFFRQRPLVPEDKQRLPGSEQYETWTSPTARRLAATVEPLVENIPGLKGLASPIKIEWLIKKMFAGVGREALNTADFIGEALEEPADETAEENVATYKGLTSDVARRTFLGDLDPKAREVVEAEIRGRETTLPVLGGIASRVYKTRPGGGLKDRAYDLGIEAANDPALIKASGGADVDEGQTRDALGERARASEDKRSSQETVDSKFLPDPGDMSPKAIDDRVEWVVLSRKADDERASTLTQISKTFPRSVWGEDITDEQRAEYFRASGESLDRAAARTRGEQLAAGYYAITPPTLTAEERALGDIDLDDMFDRREVFVGTLSETDRALLNEVLDSYRTPAEREYNADMEAIRSTGYYDILPDLIAQSGLQEAWERYSDMGYGERRSFVRTREGMNIPAVMSRARDKRDQLRYRLPREQLEVLILKWGKSRESIDQRFFRHRARSLGGY